MRSAAAIAECTPRFSQRIAPLAIFAALLAASGALAPPRCPACAAARELSEPLCRACARELTALPALVEDGPPGVDSAIAAGRYEGVVRGLVGALKFGRLLGAAEVAAAAMAAARPPELAACPLVPVPPDPLRLRWRGFDPAEEITLALAGLTGTPLARCLRREPGRRQMGRRRASRLAGPRVRTLSTSPPSVVLVDDVHTTGATLAACAWALRDGGCGRVSALTLARADRRL